MTRALLTDIEGTTSSIAFVKEVLFPYSRARLRDFVRAHASEPDTRALLDRLRGETPGSSDDEVAALLCRYIDQDRKHTVLKELQGRIWRHGYEAGDFVAHVYPDVAPALRRWKSAGLSLHVFSSGSVEAQKLLFRHSQAGDLTPLFSGFFDTTTGKKDDPAAYRAITAAIGEPPREIAFLSDTLAELDAARRAGLLTWRLDRDGEAGDGPHPCVSSFDQIGLSATGS